MIYVATARVYGSTAGMTSSTADHLHPEEKVLADSLGRHDMVSWTAKADATKICVARCRMTADDVQ